MSRVSMRERGTSVYVCLQLMWTRCLMVTTLQTKGVRTFDCVLCLLYCVMRCALWAVATVTRTVFLSTAAPLWGRKQVGSHTLLPLPLDVWKCLSMCTCFIAGDALAHTDHLTAIGHVSPAAARGHTQHYSTPHGNSGIDVSDHTRHVGSGSEGVGAWSHLAFAAPSPSAMPHPSDIAAHTTHTAGLSHDDTSVHSASGGAVGTHALGDTPAGHGELEDDDDELYAVPAHTGTGMGPCAR